MLVNGRFLGRRVRNQNSMKMVKALTDVGQFESMCWARWGATKWVKGQPRAVAQQVYDPNAEPKDQWPSAHHKELFNLVRPAFHQKCVPRVHRCHIQALGVVGGHQSVGVLATSRGDPPSPHPPDGFRASGLQGLIA